MPQVDLETLVSACAGGSCDNKIACETLAEHHPPHTEDPDETPPDFPPESFWLSKDAEIDWFDRNAFYERKESTRGASDNSANLNPNINNNNNNNNSNTTSNSQRFTNLKHKTSIIGLPKPQKTCFADAKARRSCKPGNTHLFPKRSGSRSKPAGSIIEPTSPKVSCIGRVRSKRDRSRKLKLKQRSMRSTESESSNNKPERRNKKTGLFASFKLIFRHSRKSSTNNNSNSKRGKKSNNGEQNDKSSRKTKTSSKKNSHDILDRLPASARDAPRKSVEVVGLGSMNRFASGRRGDILGADVA